MSWGSRVGGVNLGHRSRDAPHFFRGPFRRTPAPLTSDILRNVTPQRLIVAITGATGRHLRRAAARDAARGLRSKPISSSARGAAARCSTKPPTQSIRFSGSPTVTYAPNDQGAAISSGSFLTMGMAIVPCSMRTLASVAHGLGDNLIHRAADVVLKERRKLLLAPREAPLNDIHLENMLKLSRMGVVICPPMPGLLSAPRHHRRARHPQRRPHARSVRRACRRARAAGEKSSRSA